MKTIFRAATAAVAALALSMGAARADMATGSEIGEALSGMTLQGSMTEAGFAEYYAEDGSVAGDGYGGKWRIVGDDVCFVYEGTPESCWTVEMNGPAITLYKDGEVDGVGMLIEGNPNEF